MTVKLNSEFQWYPLILAALARSSERAQRCAGDSRRGSRLASGTDSRAVGFGVGTNIETTA